MLETNPEAARLTLLIDAGAEADAEELDRVSRQLLQELSDQPEVESVELKKAGEAPAGTKLGGEATMLGALALTVLPAALPPVMGFLKHWTERGQSAGRSVKIKVERGGEKMELEYDPATMTPEQLNALMAALSSRPAGGETQGGVALSAQRDMNVGQDVVGRDKIEVRAEAGATVIIHPPPEKQE